jgi:hypothetical protein
MTVGRPINYNYKPFATFQQAELTLQRGEDVIKFEGARAFGLHTQIALQPDDGRRDEALSIIWGQNSPRTDAVSGPAEISPAGLPFGT